MNTKKQQLKVAALLKVANDPRTSEHEAAAASARANVLIAKYAIDEQMLNANGGDLADFEVVKVDLGGQYIPVRSRLYGMVAKTQKAKAFSVRGDVYVIASPAQQEAIAAIFASLDLQMVNATAKARPAGVKGARLVSWRTNYQKGWTAAVTARLAEQRKMAEQDATDEHGSGVGIVLADEQLRLAKFQQDWMAENFPGMRLGRKKVRVGNGADAGRSAGGSADIGNRQIATQRALTA